MVEGNEEAFTILYDRYYRPVVSFVQQLVKLPALAEDLSQETFVRIWEAREQLAKVQSFKSYLFVAARNHALNCLKLAASEQALKGEIIRHFQQLRNSTEEEMLTQAYLQHIDRVLNSLPAQTRRIFHLCREQEHSYDEVAALLGISKNAVKKHMMRSIKSLKAAAEKDLGISFGLALVLISRL